MVANYVTLFICYFGWIFEIIQSYERYEGANKMQIEQC